MIPYKNQLKVYKRMLRWYYVSLILPRWFMGTDYGFCHVLYLMYSTYDKNNIENYSVLYSLKPENLTSSYWFKKGKIIPRIKLLKEAIKKCQIEIDNYQWQGPNLIYK